MKLKRLMMTLAVLALGALVLPSLAEGPKIGWDIDDALKQVDRQADDFISAMARVEVLTLTYMHFARNLELDPDLFSTRWPRGTDKQTMK
jgi:hypothetical protein